MQPYKVTDPERRQRIGIAASSLHQLVDIARRRLLSFAGNDRPAQLLLDDDGTLVDDPAYFALLPPQTCFMLCDVEKHQWKCADRSSLITSTVANNTRQDAPRFVKLATIERRQWLPIAVSSCTTVEHIKSVAADRFALAVESIVLDDDGCQVEDDDYLHELPHDSRLVALRRADEWTTAPECDADSVDARVAGADVSSLGMLVGESGVDVKAMLLLSDERLRVSVDLQHNIRQQKLTNIICRIT